MSKESNINAIKHALGILVIFLILVIFAIFFENFFL
ncbi:hypothetical protein J2S18_000458 [Eubacterium multiforme]|uniref:Uncharacterized protein n=1 Tax=Eubacterium multiforme TaxID=83339 RepID=A0ABT9UPG6_9FIRM|nr:hypothetical protein [Eubacterium multiforme]